jgi:sugar O-acyltransferase (sialic acid O-acetyltransferase NeuD family)
MRQPKTFTMIGVGDFVNEIVEVIGDDGVIVSCMLLGNEDEFRRSELPKETTFFTMDELADMSLTDCYIFGVINSDKKPILEKLLSRMSKDTNDDLSALFPNVIHPKSVISPSARFGFGNFVGAGCVIGSKVVIGNGNVLNRACSVGHDTVLGDFNHLAPGSTVCGNVQIGDEVSVGANACIIDQLEITSRVKLGAGAVVVNSLTQSGTYIGVPAKLKETLK